MLEIQKNCLITLLTFIFTISSCTKKPVMNTTQLADTPLTFLALGDSYTIGESVSESERWPVQLSDSLASKGVTIEKTDIIATTGWTTEELLAGIEDASPDTTYDLVSLLIGVNNQYRGYDISTYRIEFEELLQQAISFTGGDPSKVFVVSIPNYGVTPFGQTRGEDEIRKELLEYDAIAEDIATKYEIPFVNITPISEQAKTYPALVASDDLHPSGKMYTLWVEEILPIVEEMLKQ